MVYEMYYSRNNIPQTVPAGVYTPDDFAIYAENFDLSLLPNDGEIPPINHNDNTQSQLSIQTSLSPASIDYIPTTIYNNDTLLLNNHQLLTPPQQHNQQQSTSPSLSVLSMKTEKDWMKIASGNNHNTNNNNVEHLSKQICGDNNNYLNNLTINYQYHYPSPLPSPPQDNNNFNNNQFTAIYPPSPCSSVDYNTSCMSIKQEFCGSVLPPSPPDSNGVPSPLNEIKTEPEIDPEVCIDIESLLNDSFEAYEKPKKSTTTSSSSGAQQQDHQLLREYLQDTSFQRKHNLKPLALESLIGGWSTRGDIEPVFSLALEQIRKDVENTCVALDIPPDPQLWTPNQVHSWLEAQISTWKLPEISNIEHLFPESGDDFMRLAEDEFLRRLPESGATLYAQLVVWKSACAEHEGFLNTSLSTPSQQILPSSDEWSMGGHHTPSFSDLTDDEDEDMPLELPSPNQSSASTSSVPSTPGTSSTVTSPGATTTTTVPTTPRTGRQGGSHIHLWQFLKELLAAPQTHGTAIRWLDRTKGVFKIEDSVRVARLWGRRKNRPAMNYDKLSRSIRQYYKKGIMKKTERSQRLVYQFCHPYCL